jgi:uncharacterized protein with von Willebrand factor type A (vWA) domain
MSASGGGPMVDGGGTERTRPGPAVDSSLRFAVLPGSGETIDGARLLAQAVGFGRELRRAGLAVDLGAAIDYARALAMIDLGDRAEVRAAGACIFVRRHDDIEPYDRVFARWWRRRGRRSLERPTADIRDEDVTDAEASDAERTPESGEERLTRDSTDTGRPLTSPSQDESDVGEEADGVTISPEAYSRGEVARHKDFDRMTSAELRDAERLIDLLAPRLETRRTRRYELHHHGRYLAPRAMFRRNLGTGGQLLDWEWRRPVRHPRPIVVLCDISGSMERHSRLLLRFIQALTEANAVKTESFVFGTRLTRVTRLLRDRDRDRALERVSETVTDWAGGTRIGESFREFNRRWARRTLRTSGVVIVVSDGWDRGDPAIVREETARLRRNSHRLIWLNPLASSPGYRPLAAGMAAAFPFIDDFVPAGTIASLERLGTLLAGARDPRLRQRPVVGSGATEPRQTGGGDLAGVAAAHTHGGRPSVLGTPGDPSVARPLDGT